MFAEDYEFAIYVFAVVARAVSKVFSVSAFNPISIFILFRVFYDVMSRVKLAVFFDDFRH
jgi:hypothetical protein